MEQMFQGLYRMWNAGPLVLFIFFNKRIVAGITAGAVRS